MVTVVNGLQHTTLALTWSDVQSDRPNLISQLVWSCPSTYVYFLQNILSSLLSQNNSHPFILYVLEGRGWGSIVLKGRVFWPLLDCSVIKTRIWQRPRFLLLTWVYWYYIPVSTKANEFPLLVYSQHKLDSCGGA